MADNSRGNMRYVVKWLKDGKSHQMLTRETTPGGAITLAWARSSASF